MLLINYWAFKAQAVCHSGGTLAQAVCHSGGTLVIEAGLMSVCHSGGIPEQSLVKV